MPTLKHITMEVHIVIKRESEDYHGSNDEIVGVYEDKERARRVTEKLQKEDGCTHTEYYFETYSVIK